MAARTMATAAALSLVVGCGTGEPATVNDAGHEDVVELDALELDAELLEHEVDVGLAPAGGPCSTDEDCERTAFCGPGGTCRAYLCERVRGANPPRSVCYPWPCAVGEACGERLCTTVADCRRQPQEEQ